MKLSIVIPTICRPSLSKCLESLNGQDYDEIHIIRDKIKNLSNARNRGVQASSGADIIAFLDDDTEADPDFVEQGKKFFEQNPTVEIMSGAVYGLLNTSPSHFFVGANLWFRKSVFKKIGYFDEEFTIPNGPHEELDFCWRAVDALCEYSYNDLCRVNHKLPPGSDYAKRQNYERLKMKHSGRVALMENTGKTV